MKSRTTERFRRLFAGLPKRVQQQARKAYKLFQVDPGHPSLSFKPVHPSKPIYSVRISRTYRAVGVRRGEEIIWFWVGSHREYERIISSPPKDAG